VARLRRRKQRDAKPFAVMVRTLADAAEIAELTHTAAEILASPVRPVVVVPERAESRLSRGIAPRIGSVGLMLPSTPLHHLLLDLTRGPLVMTSGNLSEEPIATGIDEARARLSAVADGFLLHDREIVSRYDDSVIRVAAVDTSLRGAQRRSNRVEQGEGRAVSGGARERSDCFGPAGLAMTSRAGTIILRRARGLAPLPLRLPVPSPEPLIAVGPDLKNTFTLVEGARAYVSQHIGDLDSLETDTHFRDTLRRFEQLFQIVPSVAARDLHPGYLSTRIAEELGLPHVMPVQHHHAHIAAVLAEHGETGPVIGLAFDGTGYGDDGHVWGAEVLLADLAGYRRLAQLRYAPMPGGDRAAREPWRAALGYLSLEPDAAPAFAGAFDTVPGRERAMAALQIARRLNAPLASSMGRLFDAASAVLRVHRGRQFEGQAAMELESLAGRRAGRVLEMPLDTVGDVWQLDPLPLLIALGERRRDGADAGQLAADFHASVIAAAARIAALACERTGIRTVALGGGVFQNARFAIELPASLEAAGLRVLLPRELGPNDGAVSYGQAAVVAARLAADSPL
jgi:hydrogenase maturation protein HypF